MMKILITSASALALFALAACEGGEAPPQSGAAMDQAEPMSATPEAPPSDPAQ